MNLLRPLLIPAFALAASAQKPPAPEGQSSAPAAATNAAAPADAAESEAPEEDAGPLEKKKPAAATRAPEVAADTGAADAAAMRKKLDSFLPVGRTMNDLLIPKYKPLWQTETAQKEDGTEVRQPLWEYIFEAENATRLDDNHIAFHKARFLTFENAEDPARATTAAWLEQGVYDVQNNLLLSEQPVRIDREGMQIEGDRMLHDRKTGLTRLTGRVRMRFFAPEPEAAPEEPTDSQSAADADAQPSPEAAPAPPATEPTANPAK